MPKRRTATGHQAPGAEENDPSRPEPPAAASDDSSGSSRTRRRTKGRKKRAAWGTLSRRDVVDAALEGARGTGFEQMTIRSLAADLGVAPMSLYRHIRDKDDLLDEVADELLRRVWRTPAGADWRSDIAESAEILRRLLVTEPAVLYVYLRHPVVSPTARARMETMLEILRGAGLDDDAAHSAYAAVHTYTIGFAALEASRLDRPAGPEVAGPEVAGPEVAGPEVATPEAAEDDLAQRLAAYTDPAQFDRGLRYLLEGVERHHLARAAARPARATAKNQRGSRGVGGGRARSGDTGGGRSGRTG